MSDINIPDNNGGKYRIAGEAADPLEELPIFTSEVFEYFKKMRVELNEILSKNRAGFKDLAVLAPEGTVKNPEVLALLMLLAKRLYNADSGIVEQKK